MKKLRLYLAALLCSASLLLSCGSTPKQEPAQESRPKGENPTVKQEPAPAAESEKPVSKTEPAVSADVAFAQKLRDYLNSNDLDGALKSFDTIPAVLKENTDMQILHASLLVSAGRGKEAAEIGNTLQKKDPSNMEVLELNAEIASANGDKTAKKAILSQILAIDPYNAAANIQQAQDFAVNHKYKLACNSYKKALKNSPDNPDALFGFGQMSYYLNNIKDASDSFQKILDKNPDNAMALAYMGKLAAEDENYLRATKYVEQAIQQDDSNYDFYMDLGTYKRYQGKYDEAEKAWTKAISLDPTYFLAYAYRAGLYNEQKQYKEALADFHKVIETNPQYYYAFEEIGLLEWHEKNWAASRDGFLKALECSKDDYSYQLMIAATYWKENNIIVMKKFLEDAMKNRDRSSIEYAMLRLYHDQGGINAENDVRNKVESIDKTTQRGKLWYYTGLYYELHGLPQIADEYYAKITALKAPMFFEYELAEWGTSK